MDLEQSQQKIAHLMQVAYVQNQDTVKDKTKKQYTTVVKKLIRIIHAELGPGIYNEAFEMDEQDKIECYTGDLSGVYKLKLPITATVVQLLFAH